MNVEGYKIERLLGRGGMGSVYRARQIDLDRPVALKVIHPHLADDEDFRARFRSEMKLASKLDHPNVVPVYDAKEVDGQAFIAMALIPGENLANLISREGALDPALAVDIISQIASALDAAHDKGIIHRDVKPANVLLDDRVNHAYLSDFGIAKSLEATSAITKTGLGVGAIRYVAPEQIENRQPDRRTDVYSLGCVFFEALTGDLPFEDGSEASVLMEKLRSDPRHPSDVNPDLDPVFDQVSDIALSRNPDDRFATAGEFAQAARDALAGEAPTKVFRESSDKSRTRKLPPDPEGDLTLKQSTGASSFIRRHGAVAATGLLVLLLAAGGFGLSRTGSGSAEPDQSPELAPKRNGSDEGKTENTEVSNSRSSSDGSPAATDSVERNYFEAEIPAGWSTKEVDQRNSGRFTNVWSDPTNSDVTILIDSQRPAPSGPVMASAALVRSQTMKSKGYSEVSFSEIKLAGRPTAEWVFELPGVRKVDYFFEECGVGVAVLGTAPTSEFAAMEPTFRRTAESVAPRCEPVNANSPISTEGIGPVLVGMTKAEAEAAGNFKLDFDSHQIGSCNYAISNRMKDIGFMFNEGTFARVDVRNTEARTLSGIGVGDSEAEVFDAYGDRLSREANFYDPKNSSYLTYTPDDAADNTRVLFDVTDGKVVNIRAGRLPEIDYVEGCA